MSITPQEMPPHITTYFEKVEKRIDKKLLAGRFDMYAKEDTYYVTLRTKFTTNYGLLEKYLNRVYIKSGWKAAAIHVKAHGLLWDKIILGLVK